MQQIAMIPFIDQDSGQNGFAFLRAGSGLVCLGLSLEKDGDIEPVLKPEICEQLISALQRAVQIAHDAHERKR